MRILWIVVLLIINAPVLWAQEPVEEEKVYEVVEEKPRFPGCEDGNLAGEELATCAQQKMLAFIYSNITYPAAARENGIEGMTVIRFIVLEDGSIHDAKVVKDIGGGCGEEALRVVNLMDEMELKWIPGKQAGKAVKVFFNLPVKYKLESDNPPPPPPLPYFMAGLDTIYTEYDQAPSYGDTPTALREYLEAIPYPSGVDSCVAGAMAVQFFVSEQGEVRIGEIYDYSNLGFDYQFEVIKALNATNANWKPALRAKRPVNSYLPLRVVFKPKTQGCQTTADHFDQAYDAAAEAETLYANSDAVGAIAKWTQALELLPGNAEFLLLRGQAYLEVNEKENACMDLQEARKAVPLAGWVSQMLPLICN